MHLHKVEIQIFDKMLCNFWFDSHFIFTNAMTLCSYRMNVPSRVTILFLLFVQCKLLLHSLRDLYVDWVLRNLLHALWWQWYMSREFSMNLIVTLVWCWYCATRWKYTKFLMHSRASVKGILWIPEGFQRIAVKTGTIAGLTTFISRPLDLVRWLSGMLNRGKPGYGAIIAQSCVDLSNLECFLRNDVTQIIKCPSWNR